MFHENIYSFRVSWQLPWWQAVIAVDEIHLSLRAYERTIHAYDEIYGVIRHNQSLISNFSF